MELTTRHNEPTHLHSHLLFCQLTNQPQKSKRECKQPHRRPTDIRTNLTRQTIDREEERRHNTGLAKVAVQCSADTFVVNQSLVLRINICGENRHLRQARNRYV